VSGTPLTSKIVSARGTRAATPALLNDVLTDWFVPHTSAELITAVPATSGVAAARSSRLMLTVFAAFTLQEILLIVTAVGNIN
jgi:hypothetical protein